VIKALAKLRNSGLAEPHHIALDAWLAATDNALDDWHEAERVSVAEFNKKAVQSFPKYMQASAAALERGFFEVLRYWLGRTENMVRDNWSSYRIYLIGNYGTDLALRREINRFLVVEDPYGWREFVGFGVQRGELRTDLDVDMTGSILEWTMDRFQDALLTEELDPGLFRRSGPVPEEKEKRIEQFVELLRRAVGSERAQATGKRE